MYAKTHEFEARFKKLASHSCDPTHNFQNDMLHGDKKKEFYVPANWNKRQDLVRLLEEVKAARGFASEGAQHKELWELQKKIERDLKAGRLLKPEPTKTFSQCFMDVAETTLNQEIFMKLKEMTKQKYGENLRNQS